jgi:putative transposase
MSRAPWCGTGDPVLENVSGLNERVLAESKRIAREILPMKKSKFTGEQIAFALRQAEVGTAVAEVCRKMGIAEATFYRWKQLYGGLGASELRKMRQLEEENQKLKRLVADLSLDKVMLQEVLAKKV